MANEWSSYVGLMFMEQDAAQNGDDAIGVFA